MAQRYQRDKVEHRVRADAQIQGSAQGACRAQHQADEKHREQVAS